MLNITILSHVFVCEIMILEHETTSYIRCQFAEPDEKYQKAKFIFQSKFALKKIKSEESLQQDKHNSF